MPLPYENTTSGEKAMQDIQKILQKFGCQKFGSMMDFDTGELLVQFQYRDMNVSLKASSKGYAAAWLKEHPYSGRSRVSLRDYEKKALERGRTSIYSILRDWVKCQVMAIETGILSFEGAFLGQILLANGQTVLERAQSDKLLPKPKEA